MVPKGGIVALLGTNGAGKDHDTAGHQRPAEAGKRFIRDGYIKFNGTATSPMSWAPSVVKLGAVMVPGGAPGVQAPDRG
jgi:ABC-type branched-subunit amino acid transport system ATPase component